ncbi:glycosyltransferase [Mucilaginibacter aquaedulcis]|uniref:glycosyltransferase n=1 Tax=Mucilaginibacter aquaedulcis TaxID=1187081 RepID=UPI0025B463C1|nr:glycosyltransferase [Mucilaginibacter aquaedulcis]MDN3550160.1 glycosyltransferase [Mucilaginibacter aquaedulcis]
MISIIICSANKTLLNEVSKNIEETVGLPYEIIAIDNSSGKKGICEVYNQAAQKAQFEALCFMHEDIIIETKNWGSIVNKLFKANPDLGLLGVAGGAYKALAPSGWQTFGDINIYMHILQGFKFKQKESLLVNHNPDNQKLPAVAGVDGVWFATTRKIWNEVKFDEKTFTGFHAYDVDFSLAVGQKYKVAVTYDVLLTHLSEGNYDSTWVYESMKLHKKWSKHLPLNIQRLTPKQQMLAEKITFKKFTEQLIEYKLSLKLAYTILWQDNRYATTNFKLFAKLNFYLFKLMLSSKNRS